MEGGKEDVDAVGNRNVGCKTGMGNWYGVEKQIAMGKQYAQQVESSVKLIQDPVVTEYVNRWDRTWCATPTPKSRSRSR